MFNCDYFFKQSREEEVSEEEDEDENKESDEKDGKKADEGTAQDYPMARSVKEVFPLWVIFFCPQTVFIYSQQGAIKCVHICIISQLCWLAELVYQMM